MTITKPKKQIQISGWKNFSNKLEFQKDKFTYSTNRRRGTKSVIISTVSVVVALIVSLFIAMGVYGNGALFYQIIEQIFTAPFQGTNWKDTISYIAVFGVAALSFIYAQKVGLFNIGISGQMLIAAQIATIVSWYIPNVPNIAGQIIMLIITMAVGGLVAYVIGLLKVYLNINEVITCIMVNWIVYYAGTYMLNSLATINDKLNAAGTATSNLASNFQLAISGSGAISGSWLPLLIITFIVIIGSFLILNLSAFGKKTTCVGLSNTASQYAGINVKQKQLMTMFISGVLAGLLGAVLYLGKQNTITATITAKTIPQDGYNGISVGLIALCNPIGVLPVSLLFSMVYEAKASIGVVLNIDSTITDLMFGIIVYGAAILTVFYFFRPYLWLKRTYYTKLGVQSYEDYVNSLELQTSQSSDELRYFKTKIKQIKTNRKLKEILEQRKAACKDCLNDPKSKSFINKFTKLLNLYCNNSGQVLRINHKLYHKDYVVLKKEFSNLKSSIKPLIKYTKALREFNLATKAYNQSIKSNLSKTLCKRYNIKKYEMLLNKNTFKALKINIMVYYKLQKTILYNNLVFNTAAAKERKYENKHFDFFDQNQKSVIYQKVNSANSKLYEKYSSLFNNLINFNILEHKTYLQQTNKKSSKIIKKMGYIDAKELKYVNTRKNILTSENFKNPYGKKQYYAQIIKLIKKDNTIALTFEKDKKDKQWATIALSNLEYIIFHTKKNNIEESLHSQKYTDNLIEKTCKYVTNICDHKEIYISKMALLTSENEMLHLWTNHYSKLVKPLVKGAN